MILGDSYIEAIQVGYEDTYAAILEKNLRDAAIQAEVISVGASGWGTIHELLYYQIEGYRYQPDLIIYQFISNDPVDNTPELAHAGSVRHTARIYTLNEDRIISTPRTTQGSGINGFYDFLVGLHLPGWLWNNSNLLKLLYLSVSGGISAYFVGGTEPDPEAPLGATPTPEPLSANVVTGWERTIQAVQIWTKQAQAQGSQFVVLAQYGIRPPDVEQMFPELEERCACETLDPAPYLEAQAQVLKLPSSFWQVIPSLDYHYSPTAHRMIAEYLTAWILNHKGRP